MSAYAMFSTSGLPQLKKPNQQRSKVGTTERSSSSPKSVRIGEKIENADKSTEQTHTKFSHVTSPIHNARDHGYEKSQTGTESAGTGSVCTQEMQSCGIAIKSMNVDTKKYVTSISSTRSHSPLKSKRNHVGKKLGDDCVADALQVELTITLKGRKYEASRSFPRIRRLRHELVKEIRTRRNNHPGHFGLVRSFIFNPQQHDVIPELPEGLSDDNSSHSNDENTGETCSHDRDQSYGFVGKSVSVIQDSLMDNYGPKIDFWFQMVTKLVDPETSPSLASFLEEDEEIIKKYGVKQSELLKSKYRHSRRLRRRSPSGNLYPINEDEPVCVCDTHDKTKVDCDDITLDTAIETLDTTDDSHDDDYGVFAECDAYDEL